MARLLIFCLALSLAAPASASVQLRSVDLKTSFVAFPSKMANGNNISVAANLTVPDSDKPVAAVIIVHGSGGIDERGSFYGSALNQAGLATLELDMWAARGLQGGLSRPKHVRDTLPDIYAALQYLQQDKRIDRNNIGLIGFSWGGVVAMLMATEPPSQAQPLKAMVANYPVCWAYNQVPGYEFTQVVDGRQLMIIAGGQDLYDAPQDCRKLIDALPATDRQRVRLLSLPFATHAFELPRAASEFYDPFAFRGAGGYVPIRYNPLAAWRAKTAATDFFQQQLQ
ncbi:dienelactone hydrolase family protein [Bacterioplanes sanyensis]|uniref:dienelactone hydrolase family protein n=1 Tax=Bacterioplanes sanyensis TaxID=1249553 RepID=UPI001679FE8B|nr:dienelactone hydrolase family protein [Bacterioplanes sanyensis]